jgi:hypothetical protein
MRKLQDVPAQSGKEWQIEPLVKLNRQQAGQHFTYYLSYPNGSKLS